MQAVLLIKSILRIPTITASHSSTVVAQYVLNFCKIQQPHYVFHSYSQLCVYIHGIIWCHL